MSLLDELYEAVLDGEEEVAAELTSAGIAAGFAPQTLIDEAMIPAMSEAGRLFETEEFFVPELVTAGRAVKAALAILQPLLSDGNTQYVGRVVIGTVQGDLHDIGKNLVAVMLEGAGFHVVDLGVDVYPEQFVAAIQEHRPDVVCLSALLTTTMRAMSPIIEAIGAAGLRGGVKVLVGGAPLNDAAAEALDADGYASNANAAVRLALELVPTP